MNGNEKQRVRSQAATHAATAAVRVGPDGFRRIDGAELFGSEREVLILHGGQAYRLRITASGKLILTK